MAFSLRSCLSRTPLPQPTSLSSQTLNFLRPFSTTSPSSFPLNAGPSPEAPPYPHGFSRWYKKSNRGLYGKTRLRVHKQVSDGYPSQKVLTRWWPNVHRKRLWSACLQRYVRVRMVLRVLRSIDKAGGLDRYLLGQSPGRIRELGPTGWALRWRLLRTETGIAMWEEERRRLGLPEGRGPRDEPWELEIAEEADRLIGRARQVMEGGSGQVLSEDAEEAKALQREREIDEMLEREDKLYENEGGLDLSEGSEWQKRR